MSVQSLNPNYKVYLNLEYPNKLFSEFLKGKKTIEDVARTGMVISFFTQHPTSYQEVLDTFNDFSEMFKKRLLVITYPEKEEIRRLIEVWENNGDDFVKILTPFFKMVCMIRNVIWSKSNNVLYYHNGYEFKDPNADIPPKHFLVYSTHADLLTPYKLEEYWKLFIRHVEDKQSSNNKFLKINRRPLPKGIRHEVFKRDNFRCVECGLDNTKTTLHVDHILPLSKGGTDELSNLRTLCDKCNLEKNDLVHGGNN